MIWNTSELYSWVYFSICWWVANFSIENTVAPSTPSPDISYDSELTPSFPLFLSFLCSLARVKFSDFPVSSWSVLDAFLAESRLSLDILLDPAVSSFYLSLSAVFLPSPLVAVLTSAIGDWGEGCWHQGGKIRDNLFWFSSDVTELLEDFSLKEALLTSDVAGILWLNEYRLLAARLDRGEGDFSEGLELPLLLSDLEER